MAWDVMSGQEKAIVTVFALIAVAIAVPFFTRRYLQPRDRTYIIRTERSGLMARSATRREKWTLSFDADLKAFLVKTAERRRVYPVALLEEIVREKFNPYGHTDVKDSVEYVRMLRRRSRARSDAAFLGEIRAWQRAVSS